MSSYNESNYFKLPDKGPLVTLDDLKSKTHQPSDNSVPIVIDNGSTQLRAGFASESSPSFVCRNEGSRYKERRTNRNMMLYGDSLDLDSASKSQIKCPYESGIVTSWDTMENGLDWTFLRLGLESTPPPIVMSEPLCNLPYPRSQMSELLFEAYSTPKISYGVDSLYSFYNTGLKDGLVVSSGANTTHVIPVLDGKGIFSTCKRISWGGQQAADLLLRLIQLKYPAFPTKVTYNQANTIMENYCTFADDYSDFINSMTDPDTMKQNNYIIQFPYVAPVIEEKSAEELEKIAEKKRETSRRLQEQAAKTRLEKITTKEAELKWLDQLKDWKAKEKPQQYLKRIQSEGFDDEQDLEDFYKKIYKAFQRARDRELGIEENDNKEPPKFPLVDIPDHQLNEEDLKEKRKQKLLKAGYDARNRIKVEKEEEMKRKEELMKLDEDEKVNNHQIWLQRTRDEYAEALVRQKERERMKYDLADRKSAATQNRMRNIADLANDTKISSDKGTKRGRKRGNQQEDDTFGANDNDWSIYNEIKNNQDSDDEEEENLQLDRLEKRLLEYDPNFTLVDTRTERRKAQRKLITTFYYGGKDPYENFDHNNIDAVESPQQVEESHRLHLNVERFRVPEVIFQPSIAGSDRAGLVEMISHVLKSFNHQQKLKLLNNVHLTGGYSLQHKFDKRLHHSLLPIVPVGNPLNVTRTSDPIFDAWRGMAKWSNESDGKYGWVTKQMWDEEGPERLEARNAYSHNLTL